MRWDRHCGYRGERPGLLDELFESLHVSVHLAIAQPKFCSTDPSISAIQTLVAFFATRKWQLSEIHIALPQRYVFKPG